MKVSDVKEVPDQDLWGLQAIYDLQKELIQPYIDIEGLPEYPLDIDTKENQVLVKDFISRVVEELGEAFQEFEQMLELVSDNEPDVDKLLEHLSNLNEEASDALHFFIELLIYLNIEAVDIWDYINRLMGELNLNVEADTLQNILKVALYHNQLEGRKHFNEQHAYHIGIPYSSSGKEGVDEFLRGGRKVGPEQLKNQKIILWEITYCLQLVRNELKNKPWTQTGTPTNTEILQENVMQAFLYFGCWLAYMGHTPKSIFAIYYKKNQVNQQRIKDKR